MTLLTIVLIAAAITHVYAWGTLTGNIIYLRERGSPEGRIRPGRLSILIPARNEEANLARLLPSLLRQDHPDFEVIVVDDGSEDRTSEVIAMHERPEGPISGVRLQGPPPGWLGKVHALYQASRKASGERYLFLDADTEMLRPDSLRRIEARFAAEPENSVMTALPDLRGGGQLIVSMVSAAILTGLPWLLVGRLKIRTLGALNGQFWMIEAPDYHRFEPHETHRNEILEDVQIGRYLKAKGMTPVLANLREELAVYMYRDLSDAWLGFRKNAYLILGGTPAAFAFLWIGFVLAYAVAPFLWIGFAVSLFGLKVVCDRIMGVPWYVSLMTPVSYAMSIVLQLDSAVHHWTGRVAWKGRRVSPGGKG